MLVCIDDQGNVSRGRLPTSVSMRSGALDEQSLQDFLVRNLGHVILIVRPHGTIMRWRPDVVSEEALAGLLYVVHDLGIYRLLLETFDGKCWHHRIVNWNSNDFCRLLETEALGAPPAGTDWALRQRVSAGRAETSMAIGCLLEFWEANRTKQFSVDNGALRAMLGQVTANRFCVVDATNPSHLIVSAVGGGFMRQIQSMLLPCVGRDLTSLPDARFGDFCTTAYREAAMSTEPTIEEIDTFISVAGRRPLRRRYVRAILPLRTASNCWLLGISFDDPRVNLRAS